MTLSRSLDQLTYRNAPPAAGGQHQVVFAGRLFITTTCLLAHTGVGSSVALPLVTGALEGGPSGACYF